VNVNVNMNINIILFCFVCLYLQFTFSVLDDQGRTIHIQSDHSPGLIQNFLLLNSYFCHDL
jgi:hypothetical protein